MSIRRARIQLQMELTDGTIPADMKEALAEALKARIDQLMEDPIVLRDPRLSARMDLHWDTHGAIQIECDEEPDRDERRRLQPRGLIEAPPPGFTPEVNDADQGPAVVWMRSLDGDDYRGYVGRFDTLREARQAAAELQADCEDGDWLYWAALE